MSNDNTQQADRDILIRLDEKFTLFSTQVSKDILEIKETMRVRNADIYKRLDELTLWKNDIQSNIRFMIGISSFLGGIIGAVGTAILAITNIIHL